MSNTSVSMSGLVSLNRQQTEVLEAVLGAQVPSTMTTAQLQAYLVDADAVANAPETAPMLANMLRQSLADIRSSLNLN